MNFNIEHALAIGVVGAGGIVLLYQGFTTEGAMLLSGIMGYAFKNGVKQQSQSS